MGEDFGVVVTFDPKVKSSFKLCENFCAMTHKKIRIVFDLVLTIFQNAANGW